MFESTESLAMNACASSEFIQTETCLMVAVIRKCSLLLKDFAFQITGQLSPKYELFERERNTNSLKRNHQRVSAMMPSL